MGKFIGLTLALAAGAGAGIAGYVVLRDRAADVDEPKTSDEPTDASEDDQESKEDLPPPRRIPDVGTFSDGKLRLDIPDDPSNRPSPGGNEPGPDVEVADWD